ncbi:MAG: FG-GAP repeat protein, partial [Planctomycetota bacterium]
MHRSEFAQRLVVILVAEVLLTSTVPSTLGQVCSIHERQKLTASDASGGEWLGRSVSISGNWAIIGAAGDDDAGDNSGAAYVFRRDDNGTPLDPNDDFWIEEAKLTASDGAAGDWFGDAVSISGAWAIVGAPGRDDAGDNSGLAYAFWRDDNGTASDPSDDFWVEVQMLTASDPEARAYFGGSVTISGDRAIVSAYVFRRDENGTPLDQSDDFWIQEAKLTASDAHAIQESEGSISISGAWVIVGAPFDDHAGVMSGSAHVFHRDDNATPSDPSDDFWVEVQKLTASDAAALDYFGSVVSVGVGWAIIGAPWDDDAGWYSGSAYLFRWDDAGTPSDTDDDFWVEVQKLTALDAAGSDQFGSAVSVTGDFAIIGAPWNNDDAGSAYVYRRVDNDTPFDSRDDYWVHQAKHTHSGGNEFGVFGESVSISGDRAMVGNRLDDDAGEDSGAAYVFGVRTDGADDCNCNFIPDTTDIAEGTSEDCTGNNIPDECEPDCNENTVADSCDLVDGTSADCNTNDIPDECETDCNNNGLHDDCDIADGTSDDCNGNGIPDECDIRNSASPDCQPNAVPDECDIAGDTSADCQPDGIPDECQLSRKKVIKEGFEGSFPSPGWENIDLGMEGSWQVSTNMRYVHSGSQSVVHWGPEWWWSDSYLLTPVLDITSGTLSVWSIGCGGLCPCAQPVIDVMIVIGEPGGGDDILVGDLNEFYFDYHETWVRAVYDLGPFLPGGEFRIGFRYSPESF